MLEVESYIPLSPIHVWQYLTSNEHLAKWWGEGVTIEPVLKGKFYEPWTDKAGKKHITLGTVTAIEPGQRLQLDWINAGWTKPTRVEFLFNKTPDGITRLTVLHSGFEAFDDATRNKAVDEHRTGWQEVLEKLRKYCGAH